MTMRSILVPWWTGSVSTRQLDTAYAVARKVQAHIDVVFIQSEPERVTASADGAADSSTAAAGLPDRSSLEAQSQARSAFDEWRARLDVPSGMVDEQIRVPFADWTDRKGLPEQVILRRARLSDMTVLSFPKAGANLDRTLDAALFESGHPVMLVPERLDDYPLTHAVVAWNGSLHATRAVFSAMPLLRAAEMVTVLTTPDLADEAGKSIASGDLDIVNALQWHGIRARHKQIDIGKEAAGKSLLQAAVDLEASLLVMGAFTHSRVTTAFLGGMTGEIFRAAPSIPVLMAH